MYLELQEGEVILGCNEVMNPKRKVAGLDFDLQYAGSPRHVLATIMIVGGQESDLDRLYREVETLRPADPGTVILPSFVRPFPTFTFGVLAFFWGVGVASGWLVNELAALVLGIGFDRVDALAWILTWLLVVIGFALWTEWKADRYHAFLGRHLPQTDL